MVPPCQPGPQKRPSQHLLTREGADSSGFPFPIPLTEQMCGGRGRGCWVGHWARKTEAGSGEYGGVLPTGSLERAGTDGHIVGAQHMAGASHTVGAH